MALPALTPGRWHDPTDDPDTERWLRLFALPATLVAAFIATHSALRGLTRTFLTMWIHELGHAVTAWLCGFGAFPGPWVTPISEKRMIVVSLLAAAGLGYGVFRAWQVQHPWIAGGLIGALLVQAFLTLGMRPHAARAVVIFGGDAGCFVLGSLLVATFYVAPGTVLHRTWLRWGFLVIGAFAFMDAFTTWWDAKHTAEGVVFGEIEGVGESDPTRLAFTYGWSEAKIVSRYLRLAWTCAAFLVVTYLMGQRAASRASRDDSV
jgi:hypothetical protein